MYTITASVPLTTPPTWAITERALIHLMNEAITPYLAKYTNADGALIWCGKLHPGDSADDFFEAFVNWPLLYLLGGDAALLDVSMREWEAMLRQLTELGSLEEEYERGSDQFHQGEGNLLFYALCMADPTNPRLRDVAERYAGFFLGDSPTGNYDAERHLLRAPRNGSGGPRWGYFEGEVTYPWRFDMAAYGLPYDDLPGISSYDDLRDPEKARRMGEAMHARMGRGDVATNLIVTSLMTNAFLLTGDERYRRWVVEYATAWVARRDPTTGLLADNVGPSGQIGELLGGKWYGGLYGWTWPHGYYNIGIAATVAATNATLLTGDTAHLALSRTLLDTMLALGEQRPVDLARMTLAHHFPTILATMPLEQPTLQIPYRYGDHGWFDWHPMALTVPTNVWVVAHAPEDWERVQRLHEASGYDWSAVISFHTKEDAGHEEAWLSYLAGENPTYPEAILTASMEQVYERLRRIRADMEDLTDIPDDQIDSKVHHWQLMNPITTEALVQLTLGAPQTLYNGGLLLAPLRYYDGLARRPGLPPEVAALVTQQDATNITIHLVNLSAAEDRQVIVQAGAFGQHHFRQVAYNTQVANSPDRPLGYPGEARAVAQAAATLRKAGEIRHMHDIDAPHLAVHLPPGKQITLTFVMAWLQHTPSYAFPWSATDSAPSPCLSASEV